MKTIKILLISILVLQLGWIYILSSLLSFDKPNVSENEICETLNYFKTEYVSQPPKKQQIQDIESLYGKKYKLTYRNLNEYGKANPLFQLIVLDYDIPITYFGRTLAHEIEHLKFEFRERVVEYRAIIKLWESGIPYFKYQAYIGAKNSLENRVGIRYNCTNLLVKYTTNS